MLNPRLSTLNPNAAEYVPLFKRGTNDQSQGLNLFTEGLKSSERKPAGHGAVSSKGYYYDQCYGSCGSSAKKLNDMGGNTVLDEDSLMDLEYLQMEFPGVSEESLVGAYLANNADLDGTIEMLNHLESNVLEPSENLPDTLDIGDIPEPSSQSEDIPVKLKNVAGESSASSSSRSGSAVVA